MAEVKLFIYKGSKSGDGITFSQEKTLSFDKDVLLPPKINEDATTGVKTITSTTIKNTYKFTVTLTKLNYHKFVYKPCVIHADLQIGTIQLSTTKTETVKTIDKDGKELTSSDNQLSKSDFVDTSYKDLTKLMTGSKVILQINDSTVAENYLVFKVRTIYKTVSNKTSKFIELTIHSADKLMDLDKYSRAYTAKRLYTDILAEESKNFSLRDSLKKEDCTLMSSLIANHMQLMKYKGTRTEDSKTYEWSGRDELRIPYIVQYNESFYHFMVRNANRFGEFLYFEDGKLNLGMQPSEARYYKTVGSDQVVIDWAVEPNAVQSRYYDSVLSESIAVEDRAYNFTEHEKSNSETYAPKTDSRYNFDPVSVDEWTKQDLKHNEYLPIGEVLGEELKASIPEFLFKAMNSTSVSEALVGLVMEVASKIYEVTNSAADYNHVLDDSNYKDKDDNSLVFDDQKSSDGHFNEFATYDGSTNLLNNLSTLFDASDVNNFTDVFYPLIRRKEKEVGEQAVWLDFGSNYFPIKLGDKLNVDETNYVVILVEGSYEMVEKTTEDGKKESVIEDHLLVSALPVMELSETLTAGALVPTDEEGWTNSIPIPPALPSVIIRDARPQTAFVAETLDPQNMGRIRVRYPWQDSDGDASPWIRVTLPLATDGGAVNFTPNEGDEVMVGYEHGNIDRPYAMGYLTAPFVNERWKNALPLDQYGGVHGIKVKTGHHLLFSDGANAATLLASTMGPLACLKSLWPMGWWGAWPLGDETSSDLGGGFELSDRYGFYKISGSTDDRSITIESPAGTVEVNAFQGITISAPNGDVNITGKNVNISANNTLNITSGNTFKDRFYYQKEWEDSQFKTLAGSFLSGVKESLLSETKEKFMDMSFLRCVVEWFLRPVDGTLQIKSYTFVRIEAGEGSTEMPRASLKRDKAYKKEDDKLSDFRKYYLTASLMKTNVYAHVDNIHRKWDKLCEATEAFNAISGEKGINKSESAKTYNDIITYAVGTTGATAYRNDDTSFSWDNDAENGNDLKYNLTACDTVPPDPHDQNYVNNAAKLKKDQAAYEKSVTNYFNQRNKKNAARKKKREQIVAVSNNLRSAAYELAQAAKKWTNMEDNDVILNDNPADNVDRNTIKAKISEATFLTTYGIPPVADMKNGNYKNNKTVIKKYEKSSWNTQKKLLARFLVYKYINGIADLTKNVNVRFVSAQSTALNDDWKEFACNVEGNQLTGFMKIALDKAKKIMMHDYNPFSGIYKGVWENVTKWNGDNFKGKILLSEKEDETAFFDENHAMKTYKNREFYGENITALRELLKKM